ncbi:MAG: DNA polymerase Y family protein [Candidatus Sumerlaeaceae bacterium]
MSRVNWIVHLDGDAFAVAVERRRGRAPAEGVAVLVGNEADGRGTVNCASYEARARGVSNGAPLRWAMWRLGNKAVVVPRDLLAYEQAAREVFEWLRGTAPVVEMIGLDDFFLDLTGCDRWCGGDVARWVTNLLLRMQRKLGLPFSGGVGTNKIVAKLASRVAKPAGVTTVPPGAEAEFLRPMAVGTVPQLEPQVVRQLEELGCRRVEEALALGRERLCLLFGDSRGERLWSILEGKWHEPVRSTHLAPRVEAEYLFEPDTCMPSLLAAALRWMVEKVAWELRQGGQRCAALVFTGIYCDGGTVRRCMRLAYPTDRSHELADVARPWVELMLKRRVRVRRLHLEARAEGGVVMDDFFEEQRLRRTKHLYEAADRVRERYGLASLVSAAALPVVWELKKQGTASGRRKKETPRQRWAVKGAEGKASGKRETP